MNKRDWQERTTVDNIDAALSQTTAYIRIIPGQEWALWKVGNRYCIQQVLPAKGKQKTSASLTELLLWFTLGDAIKRGQYDPLPSGNVVSFSEKRGGTR
jgi:hypothetical protein